MQGIIHNYRRGRHRQTPNQAIVYTQDVSSREQAEKLVGKTVEWHTGKRTIKGEVRAAHGNSGALRVLFDTGLPGQSIGQTVDISVHDEGRNQ